MIQTYQSCRTLMCQNFIPLENMPDLPFEAFEQCVNQRTYCLKCQADLDGPCFEHTSPDGIIYDKLPIPLAYSSLPDVLSIFSEPNDVDSDKTIIATAKIKAGTLLGPLIAPLIPLDEPEDPSRYVLWSEDTQELLAYDLSNDYSCNWIKFMQPSWNSDEINVMAYQQGEFIYFITLKEMLPNTQLRVYVKIASCCEPPPGWIDVDSMDLELSLTQGSPSMSPVEPETTCEEVLRRELFEEASQAADIQIDGSSPTTVIVSKKKPVSSAKSTRKTFPRVAERRRMEKLYEEGGLTEAQKEQYEEDVGHWRIVEARIKRKTQAAAARWKADKKRYESDGMTADEKGEHEEKAGRLQEQWKRSNKNNKDRRTNVTDEQREKNNSKSRKRWNATLPEDRPKRVESYRLKMIRGEALTAKEQLQYEKNLVKARKATVLKAMKERIAKGKAPLDFFPKPGSRAPMFEWEKAAAQAANAATENLDSEALGAPRPLERYSDYTLSLALSHSLRPSSDKTTGLEQNNGSSP